LLNVIALDLDGTLLNDDKIVSRRSVEVLLNLKARGFKIIFATARALR